ncbi:hypothetical protein C8R43DRAFT_962147 [Mycena crocata]|nr:hypothetical protein C8R43DRAFT_962147 [Mycena crocata]
MPTTLHVVTRSRNGNTMENELPNQNSRNPPLPEVREDTLLYSGLIFGDVSAESGKLGDRPFALHGVLSQGIGSKVTTHAVNMQCRPRGSKSPITLFSIGTTQLRHSLSLPILHLFETFWAQSPRKALRNNLWPNSASIRALYSRYEPTFTLPPSFRVPHAGDVCGRQAIDGMGLHFFESDFKCEHLTLSSVWGTARGGLDQRPVLV